MIQATSFIWPQTYKTRLMQNLFAIIRDFRVNIKNHILDGTIEPNDYANLVLEQKNTIVWTSHGVPYDEQRKNVNILFLENGPLLRQRTLFMDENGFGAQSNVVLRRHNVARYSKKDIDDLLAELERDNYILTSKENNSKVVMIALQGFQDNIILNKCIKFLPNCEKVVVRGHPQRKERCRAIFDELCRNMPNWEYDNEESANDSLSRCEALVTSHSSLMYRAMLMGIKVATCSQGFHTGSPAVLDCTRNPQLLGGVFRHKSNYDSIMSLLCGIQTSVLPYSASKEKILNYTNFGNWLARLKP